MGFQTGNSNTEERVFAFIRQNQPTTIKIMAKEMPDISHQTIRNYVDKLARQDRIRIHYAKIDRSVAYEVARGGQAGFAVRYGEESKKLRTFLEEISQQGRIPNHYINNHTIKPIVEMYRMAADALDDDNPYPVPTNELQQIQFDFANWRAELISLIRFCDDMLDHAGLWNPNELPKILILNDQLLTPEMVRSMLDRIGD